MGSEKIDYQTQIQKKLIQMIKDMSFENQLALLEYLREDKKTDRRKFPRKQCFMEVNYATQKVCDNNYMKDISEGGLFVQTDKKVAVGDDIILTFSFPGKSYIVKAVGCVVRIEKDGIGIEFQNEMMKDINKITNFIHTL
ncbi:MAG: PilZ domain-containing protein [Candidatus Magnetomorum sp.]|nr:PilZ domain-containing protein [Candidatus Magnetomorum sp.]